MTTDLDALRHAALAKADRAALQFKFWFALAALVETAGVIGLFLLIDIHDPLHQLLLVIVFLTYGTLAACMMWLGAYLKWWGLRLLRGIEELHADPDGTGARPG